MNLKTAVIYGVSILLGIITTILMIVGKHLEDVDK